MSTASFRPPSRRRTMDPRRAAGADHQSATPVVAEPATSPPFAAKIDLGGVSTDAGGQSSSTESVPSAGEEHLLSAGVRSMAVVGRAEEPSGTTDAAAISSTSSSSHNNIKPPFGPASSSTTTTTMFCSKSTTAASSVFQTPKHSDQQLTIERSESNVSQASSNTLHVPGNGTAGPPRHRTRPSQERSSNVSNSTTASASKIRGSGSGTSCAPDRRGSARRKSMIDLEQKLQEPLLGTRRGVEENEEFRAAEEKPPPSPVMPALVTHSLKATSEMAAQKFGNTLGYIQECVQKGPEGVRSLTFVGGVIMPSTTGSRC
ncbi:unnamed protein product [Amoebophrya sp. A120]|nr:unnamed protein product [Amoebophrya sp. A120]|eukprot:GSA120T00011035001.1